MIGDHQQIPCHNFQDKSPASFTFKDITSTSPSWTPVSVKWYAIHYKHKIYDKSQKRSSWVLSFFCRHNTWFKIHFVEVYVVLQTLAAVNADPVNLANSV